MPKPIHLSQNEITWFANFILEKYNLNVVDSYDCELLQLAIYKSHKINISVSTLRRMFCDQNYQNGFSKFSLNSICRSVGFLDFEKFQLYVENFNSEKINQALQLYEIDQKKYGGALEDAVSNMCFKSWTEVFQLKNVISQCILKEDYALLKKVLHLEINWFKSNSNDFLSYAFQNIYFAAKNGDKKLIQFILENCNSSKNLQLYLLQSYVDEKALNSFFFFWLNSVNHYLLYDFKLFQNLLFVQFYYDSNNMDIAHRLLHVSEIEFQKISAHPILIARIYVWKSILKKEKNDFISLVNSFQDITQKLDFIVIASRLIWEYNSIHFYQEFINEINLEDLPKLLNFYEQSRFNVYLLTKAFNHSINDQILECSECFSKVNQMDLGYDIVNFNFYLNIYSKIKTRLASVKP